MSEGDVRPFKAVSLDSKSCGWISVPWRDATLHLSEQERCHLRSAAFSLDCQQSHIHTAWYYFLLYDLLACIFLCVQITLHSRVRLFITIPDTPDALSHSHSVKHTINSTIKSEVGQRFNQTTQSPLSFLFLIYVAPLSLTAATVTRHGIGNVTCRRAGRRKKSV